MLESLILHSELVEVVTYEVLAKRSSPGEMGEPNPQSIVPVQPNFTLTNMVAPDKSGFLIRLAIDATLPHGRVLCDMGAAFRITGQADLDIEPPLLVEFANTTALDILIPYLRQNIADLTQRTFGSTLLMPLMPHGTLVFTAE